jgi:hypothetical protein
MRLPLPVVIALTFMAWPAAATLAQGPAPTSPALPSWAPAASPLLPGPVALDTVRRSHPTHWKVGFTIGAALGALLGGAFANALCNGSDVRSGCTAPTVGGALLTATAVGTIGALIGGAFPKRE